MKKLRGVLSGIAVLVALAYGAFLLSRSRTFQLFGELVPRVETPRKVVALTFDDGPVTFTADEIVSTLRRHNVKATFFLCGAQMAEAPGVAERLLAEGHELGNHSWSHTRMVLKTPRFIRDEIEKTDALIRKTGYSRPIHFRPPYCKKLLLLPWYLDRTNRISITWDVDPESRPEVDADAQKLVADVLARVRPGSIVLLHPWYRGRSRTRQAVPAIIAGLHQRGYEFVTVSELLALDQQRYPTRQAQARSRSAF
jgi:peptidoglycan-N-acetylglucosamine deacetylase